MIIDIINDHNPKLTQDDGNDFIHPYIDFKTYDGNDFIHPYIDFKTYLCSMI
jgi:hypothetical protein